MTEHKQWLSELKCGDGVAVRNRPIGRFMDRELGWRLYTVTHITPKRTKFELTPRTTQLSVISLTGDHMKPVTPEIRESIAKDSNRIRAHVKADRVYTALTAALGRSTEVDWTGAESQLDALLMVLESPKKE